MSPETIANRVFRNVRNGCPIADTAVYVAVPGNENARWLLPAGNSGIDGVLANWQPYRLKSRLAWAGVRAASKIGQVSEIPGSSVLEVEGASSTDWSELGWPGNEAPVPVIYLGTPGPRRKAVVHLADRVSGKCRAVVKVPLTDEARVALLHEAEVLKAMAEARFEWAPRLLHVDHASGITTQDFVEGQPGSRSLGPEVWRLLGSLLLPGETTSLEAHAERWEQGISGAAGAASVASAVEELRDSTPLPACWEHGDFAPWNIKRLSDGRCALLDWEDARREGLPLQDAYHFLHIQDYLFEKRPRSHAAEVVTEAAATMGLTPTQCHKLEAAYLVGAYVRCMQRGNHERARFVERTLALRGSRSA